MKLAAMFFVLMAIVSCKPEQEVTEFSVTISPKPGETVEASTSEDEPILISYSVDKDEDSIDLTFEMIEKPANGTLSDCKYLTKTEWQCIYIPNKDFFGEDKVTFKTKDGDFSSKEKSFINIKITAIADAPSAGKDQESEIFEDQELTFEVNKASDPDTELNDLTYKMVNDFDINTIGSFKNCFESTKPLSCTFVPHKNILGDGNEQAFTQFKYKVTDKDSKNDKLNTALVRVTIKKRWIPTDGTFSIDIKEKESNTLIVFAIDISSSMDPFIVSMKKNVLALIDKIVEKKFKATIAFITSDQTITDSWTTETNVETPHPNFSSVPGSWKKTQYDKPPENAMSVHNIDASTQTSREEIPAIKVAISDFLNTFLIDPKTDTRTPEEKWIQDSRYDDERLLCSTLRILYSNHADKKEFVGIFSLSNEEDAAKTKIGGNVNWLKTAYDDCKKDIVTENIPSFCKEKIPCQWNEPNCKGEFKYEYTYDSYVNPTPEEFEIGYTIQQREKIPKKIYEVQGYPQAAIYGNKYKTDEEIKGLCLEFNTSTFIEGTKLVNTTTNNETNNTKAKTNTGIEVKCEKNESTNNYRYGTYNEETFHAELRLTPGVVAPHSDNIDGSALIPTWISDGPAKPIPFNLQTGTCSAKSYSNTYLTKPTYVGQTAKKQTQTSCTDNSVARYTCKTYQDYSFANNTPGACPAISSTHWTNTWNGTCKERSINTTCKVDHRNKITGYSDPEDIQTYIVDSNQRCSDAIDSNGNKVIFATKSDFPNVEDCTAVTPVKEHATLKVDGPNFETITFQPSKYSHLNRPTCKAWENYFATLNPKRTITSCTSSKDAYIGDLKTDNKGVKKEADNLAVENCNAYLTGKNITFNNCSERSWIGEVEKPGDVCPLEIKDSSQNWFAGGYSDEDIAQEKQTLAKSLAYKLKSYTKAVYLTFIHDEVANPVAFANIASSGTELEAAECNVEVYNQKKIDYPGAIDGKQFKAVVGLLNAGVSEQNNTKGLVYSVCSPNYSAEELNFLIDKAQLSFKIVGYEGYKDLTIKSVKLNYLAASKKQSISLSSTQYEYKNGTLLLKGSNTANLVDGLSNVSVAFHALRGL